MELLAAATRSTKDIARARAYASWLTRDLAAHLWGAALVRPVLYLIETPMQTLHFPVGAFTILPRAQTGGRNIGVGVGGTVKDSRVPWNSKQSGAERDALFGLVRRLCPHCVLWLDDLNDDLRTSLGEDKGAGSPVILDERGSVRMVVNVITGEVIQRLQYDPWGRTVSNTNAGFQPFGYAGGLPDDETGIIHFGARDYDPATGSWMTSDPQGLGGGTWNSYEYASDNPIDFVDPSGRTCRDAQGNSVQCHVSEAGVTYIASFEGFINHKYLDPAKLPTIGYGHHILPGENFPATITKECGVKLMQRDLAERVQDGLDAITVDLDQNQVDALGDLIYNIGSGHFKGSNVLRLLNACDFAGAAREMLTWRKAGGRVMQDLVTRRKKDFQLFTTGIYNPGY